VVDLQQWDGTSTLYRVNTGAIPLIVTVPGAMGSQGTPTGLVFNGGTGFVVTNSAGTSPARFIFSSEDAQSPDLGESLGHRRGQLGERGSVQGAGHRHRHRHRRLSLRDQLPRGHG